MSTYQAVRGIVVPDGLNSGAVQGGVLTSGGLGSGQVTAAHLTSGIILPGPGIGVTFGLSGILVSNLSGAGGAGGLTSGAVGSGMIASGAVQGFYGSTRHIASGTIGGPDFASGTTSPFAGGSIAFHSGSAFPGITGEDISGIRTVCRDRSGIIIIAMAGNNQRQPAIGIVVDNVASGQPVTVYRQVAHQATSGLLSFSGTGALLSMKDLILYMGRSGQIAQRDLSWLSGGFGGNALSQQVGWVLNSGAGLFDVTPEIVIHTIYGEYPLENTNSGAVNEARIMMRSGGITGQYMGSGAINSGHLASGAVANVSIGASAVGSGKIAPGSVWGGVGPGTSTILSGSIGGLEIASGLVRTDNLASGLINATHISSGAVQGFFGAARHIASGTVGVSDFGSGAVVAGAVGSGAIQSGNIASGAVGFGHIANGAVRSGSIASGNVAQNHFASGVMALISGDYYRNWLDNGGFNNAGSLSSGPRLYNVLSSGLSGTDSVGPISWWGATHSGAHVAFQQWDRLLSGWASGIVNRYYSQWRFGGSGKFAMYQAIPSDDSQALANSILNFQVAVRLGPATSGLLLRFGLLQTVSGVAPDIKPNSLVSGWAFATSGTDPTWGSGVALLGTAGTIAGTSGVWNTFSVVTRAASGHVCLIPAIWANQPLASGATINVAEAGVYVE